jgi:tetratricopeptide (TPR) repeat protein
VRGLRLAAAASVVLGVAPPSGAGADAHYLELVSRYVEGDRAGAVAALEDLSEGELESGIRSLRGRPRLLRAAAMLHTDRHDLERRPLIGAEGEPLCGSRLHDRLAEHAVQQLLKQPEGRDFARRWYLAMSYQEHWGRCVNAALEWAESGLRWFPDDTTLLLERGTLLELFATLASETTTGTLLATPGARNGLPGSARQAHELSFERSRRLGDARRALERALLKDPALDAARLRLGRVLWRIGDASAGRAALERVRDSAQPAVRRLARLFLGRIHEDARELDAAIREYRAALELEPTSQVAAVALAHALQLAGEPAPGREALEYALAYAGRRPDVDPFWEYPMGESRSYPELVDALREEAAAP